MQVDEKHRKRVQQAITRLMLFSVVVVVIWIGLEIYWSYFSAEEELDIDPELLINIEPGLYLDLAEELSQRLEIDPQELDLFEQEIRQNPQLLQAVSSLNQELEQRLNNPVTAPAEEASLPAEISSPSSQ